LTPRLDTPNHIRRALGRIARPAFSRNLGFRLAVSQTTGQVGNKPTNQFAGRPASQ